MLYHEHVCTVAVLHHSLQMTVVVKRTLTHEPFEREIDGGHADEYDNVLRRETGVSDDKSSGGKLSDSMRVCVLWGS